MGHALHVAQEGGKVLYAKTLKGLGGGAAVIEICDDCKCTSSRLPEEVEEGD